MLFHTATSSKGRERYGRDAATSLKNGAKRNKKGDTNAAAVIVALTKGVFESG
jgi:hypothetical protein